MTNRIGLYLHIPFCHTRCDFCAFYLELYRTAAADSFIRSIKREIRLRSSHEEISGYSFESVYFGGGTPTSLPAEKLVELLADIRCSFCLTPDCEISVEAHPGTVSLQDLKRLALAGFNRISFGAESMRDDELVRIGRPAFARDTVRAVNQARDAGFTNINFDLMYGLPGQSLQSYSETLQQILDLEPFHISCYALTVEPGTKLAHDIEHCRRDPPDDTIQIFMDRRARMMLAQAGYQQYEISNYARPGYACRHNLLYWTDGDYLGLGPSAQSYVRGVRFGNVANLTAYHTALAQEQLPIQDLTTLSEEERLRDAVIFGLRLFQGVTTQQLNEHAANYGHTAVLEELRGGLLIEEEGGWSRLSEQGRLQADTVAQKLY